MNSTIAKRRVNDVIKTDTINAAQGDFMATHVPVKKLHLLSRFDESPHDEKDYTEEDVYNEIVMNPRDEHQFVIVYGASGAGKSHLIRWFETKLANEKNEDEVVLLIRRSDNSLKGTIRQLLDIPEVKKLPNHDLYKKLVSATNVVNENELKNMIYNEFIALIRSDDDDNKTIRLSAVEKKRLLAFLNNADVTEFEMRDGGPVERIYSKVAGSTVIDRDIIAEFQPEDFRVSEDTLDMLISNGADMYAQRMARKLSVDDDDSEKVKIANYINQFVDPVIQHCANLEPGDFEQVFSDIRKELYNQGKKLTLFIEDITAFTGVDSALLNVLTTNHTGDYEKEHMCRISSIVGTTIVYFQNNFNDNHKDRVTRFIYIPTNLFDPERDPDSLYEFTGKYLNTMSLEKDVIDEWVNLGAKMSEYPVHELLEGDGWDSVDCDNGKRLNLYPFTKNAIRNLVSVRLSEARRTPRYLLRDVLEPVLKDALYNVDNFPSKNLKLSVSNPNTALRNFIIQSVGENNDLIDRLIIFTGIWGNNKNETYEKEGIKYIAGIPTKIYEDLNLPILQLNSVEPPKMNHEAKEIVDHRDQKDEKDMAEPVKNVSPEMMSRMNEATKNIEEWAQGSVSAIDISMTSGAVGELHRAVDAISDFVFNGIDWQLYGISNDDIFRVHDSSIRFIGLEHQTKNNAIYYLPASRTAQSQTLLECFMRYNLLGKKSWDYDNSDDDIYYVTTWLYATTDSIVSAVKSYTDNSKTSYVEAAMAADMYRLILNGTYAGKKTFKEINRDYFFDSNNLADIKTNSHSKEWNNLLANICMGKNIDQKVRDVIDQYYNLIQGSQKRSNIIFLDEPRFEKSFRKVKEGRLYKGSFDLYLDDKVKQRRDFSMHLNDILERVDPVANAEKSIAEPYLDKFKNAFEIESIDEIDTDDIEEFCEEVKKFHRNINEYGVNVQVENTLADKIIKKPRKILEAAKTIDLAKNYDNAVDVLLAYSVDPLTELKEICALIDVVKKEMERTNIDLERKRTGIMDKLSTDKGFYAEKKQKIEACKKQIEGMR